MNVTIRLTKKNFKKELKKSGEKPSLVLFRIYKFGATVFKNFIAISNPMKQAALAGKALSITGVTPLYRANGPSLRINSLNTSRMPLYVPGGAGSEMKSIYLVLI